MDYQVADLLAQLEADGLADDTIIMFYSDHGVGLPGMKKWVWEGGLHVPLIVYSPEKYRDLLPTSPGGETDQLVSFVDLAPTALSIAGVDIPEHMQGFAFLGDQKAEPRKSVFIIRDRMAERYDTIRGVRDHEYQYLRNFMPHLPWSQFVSYTEEMPTMRVWREMYEARQLDPVQRRYFETKPVEELYDVKRDPHQVNNLADDPAYAEVLIRMRLQTSLTMIATHDLGLLPEYEMHRRSEGQTPYELALDKGANPVGKLIPAVSLANNADPEQIPQILKLLEDNDPAIRYWAAIGLVTLGKDAKPAEAALRKAITDESPNVRIAAAEALCNIGQLDLAMPVLLEGLKHPTPFIRLRAINVMDRLDEAAVPYVAEMRAAKMSAGTIMPADFLNRMTEYVPEQIEQMTGDDPE